MKGTKATDPHPRCPKCGKPGKASGAQQFRKVHGIKRLHAHMTDASGHEWWDRSPEGRRMGREEDKRRRAAGGDIGAPEPPIPAVG